jgi:hypothetical protein
MSIKPLDRLLFAQGQCCFFCDQPLPREAASVEHLLAKSHAGTNELDNCVACCKALNQIFGDMTLKAKLQVVLRQGGDFRCPQQSMEPVSPNAVAPTLSVVNPALLDQAISDLRKRGDARPRTLKSLRSALSARFAKELDGASVRPLVDHLRALGVVILGDDGTLRYGSMQQSA